MKKIPLLILCLALISLACLTPAAIAETLPTATAAADAQPIAKKDIVPTIIKVPVTAETAATCARVIAIDALNMRKGPSEKDIVLSWLKNNDIVVVVDQVNADWWHIESAVYSGYARSIYLEESECE